MNIKLPSFITKIKFPSLDKLKVPSLRKSPAVLLAVLGGICVLVLAIASLCYAVYFKRIDQPVVRMLGGWMPAARVGNTYVSYGKFLESRDTMRTYLQSPLAKKQGIDPGMTVDLEKSSLDRLMREVAINDMAKKVGVSVPDEDVRGSFAQMIAMSSTTIPNVAAYLKETFNWDEEQYRMNIVKPAILEERVAATMTSDTQQQFVLIQQALTDRLAKPDAKIFLRF